MKSELRKKLDTEFEELEATGAEGKKGVEDAKKIFKLQEEQDKKNEAELVEQIEANKKNKFAYNVFLAEALIKALNELEMPLGWKHKVAPTEIGIIMEIETPGPRFFRSAFKTTGDGYYDLNAVKTMVVRVDNLIDHLPEQKTKSGIIVS